MSLHRRYCYCVADFLSPLSQTPYHNRGLCFHLESCRLSFRPHLGYVSCSGLLHGLLRVDRSSSAAHVRLSRTQYAVLPSPAASASCDWLQSLPSTSIHRHALPSASDAHDDGRGWAFRCSQSLRRSEHGLSIAAVHAATADGLHSAADDGRAQSLQAEHDDDRRRITFRARSVRYWRTAIAAPNAERTFRRTAATATHPLTADRNGSLRQWLSSTFRSAASTAAAIVSLR